MAPGTERTDAGDFVLEEGFAAAQEVPERIAGYQIERLLGAGGMGRVYLAVHGAMERHVALKTLSAERMSDKESIARFDAEVRAAAKLLHPNIVTAFDAGHAEGVHYLAMEYVDGPTISEVVTKSGPLTVAQAVNVLRQASLGVQHAHNAAIIHRDIKPGNLMQAPGNLIKVLDLGLATIGTDQRGRWRSDRLVGTVEYMAPELIDAPQRATIQTDIYSLGATFFFLLTGRTPYEGELLEQIRGHREDSVPELCSLRHDVDVRLEHVLQRMMAKRPQDRYSTIAELLEDLEHWRVSFGVHAVPPAARLAAPESPTLSGNTTATFGSEVLGIDFGMFYAAAARASAQGQSTHLSAGGDGKPLMRMALSSEGRQIRVGASALALRARHPERVTHCLPLYIGQSTVERHVAGQCCPPEVLMAMVLNRVAGVAWDLDREPQAVAVTIPATYDQLHRRSLQQACRLAGFREVRLIDRCVAASQANLASRLPDQKANDSLRESSMQLVVCVTGNATECSLLRIVGGRVVQLAIHGTWHQGVLTWQHRLVEMAAQQCAQKYGFDPRERLADAVELQMACERSLNQFLLHPKLEVRFRARNQYCVVEVRREALGWQCHEWLQEFQRSIDQALASPHLNDCQLDSCLTFGLLTKMPQVRKAIREAIGGKVPMETIERPDLARGAALALAGELPGRQGVPLPPQTCTPHTLGVFAHAGKSQTRQFLPLVPAGTMLPARTTRRIQVAPAKTHRPALRIVEQRGRSGPQSHTIGHLPLSEISEANAPEALEVGLHLDSNGLLSLRVRNPESQAVPSLEPLPADPLSAEQKRFWADWLQEVLPAGKLRK